MLPVREKNGIGKVSAFTFCIVEAELNWTKLSSAFGREMSENPYFSKFELSSQQFLEFTLFFVARISCQNWNFCIFDGAERNRQKVWKEVDLK